MNPVTFLEPVRLQQLLYPPPGESGSVQRGCLLYSHHDSYSYNPVPSGVLPWLLGATGYLTLSIQDSFMAGSASLVASWFWLLPALSFKRKQPFFLRLRIAILTSLVDLLAITAPDWDSVNLLISHSIFLIMENRSVCRISYSRLFTSLFSIPEEVAHSNSWEIVLS